MAQPNTSKHNLMMLFFFKYAPIIDNHLSSKKFRPYKMACLEKHNFIPSHSKPYPTKWLARSNYYKMRVHVPQLKPCSLKLGSHFLVLSPNRSIETHKSKNIHTTSFCHFVVVTAFWAGGFRSEWGREELKSVNFQWHLSSII